MKYHFSAQKLEEMERYTWLTSRERIVFDLYYRDGERIEYIAAELDVSRSTIERDLRNIRQKTNSSQNDV